MATVSPWVISYFLQPGQRLGEVVAVLLQHRGHRVEPFQRGRQFGFSLSATSPDSCLGHRGGVGEQVDDRLAAFDEHAEQIVGVEDQRVDLLAAFGQHPGDVGRRA